MLVVTLVMGISMPFKPTNRQIDGLELATFPSKLICTFDLPICPDLISWACVSLMFRGVYHSQGCSHEGLGGLDRRLWPHGPQPRDAPTKSHGPLLPPSDNFTKQENCSSQTGPSIACYLSTIRFVLLGNLAPHGNRSQQPAYFRKLYFFAN